MYQSPPTIKPVRLAFLLWIGMHLCIAVFVIYLFPLYLNEISDDIASRYFSHTIAADDTIGYIMLEFLVGILCSSIQPYFLGRGRAIIRWTLFSWSGWILIITLRILLISVWQFNYDGWFESTGLVFTVLIGIIMGIMYGAIMQRDRWHWIGGSVLAFLSADLLYLCIPNARYFNVQFHSIFAIYYVHAIIHWGWYSIILGWLLNQHLRKNRTIRSSSHRVALSGL